MQGFAKLLDPVSDQLVSDRLHADTCLPQILHLLLGLGDPLCNRAAVHHAVSERKLSATERDVLELSFPFDAGLKISPARAEKKPFFQEHYGFGRNRRDACNHDDIGRRRLHRRGFGCGLLDRLQRRNVDGRTRHLR